MTKQVVKGNFVCQTKSVPDGVLIYVKTQKSGSVQQILVPNENVCLTWACQKREFTVPHSLHHMHVITCQHMSLCFCLVDSTEVLNAKRSLLGSYT